MTSCNLQNYF